jgi:uncharacterized protein (TIGR03118 family)
MRMIVRACVPLALGMLLHGPIAQGQQMQQYKVTNLTSNMSGVATNTDPHLVNPWGLSRSSGSPWWVSDNGTGLSTLYSGTGSTVSLVVTIPPANANNGVGSPTGTIYNGSKSFEIAPKQPASFLFVTEDGTISGWSYSVNPSKAIIAVNTHGASSFKGATIATVNDPFAGPSLYLYAADFRKGRIAIFDGHFHHVSYLEEKFDDDQLPEGYVPFNVQNVGGNLVVTYALQDSSRTNEIDGTGFGYADIFSPEGRLLVRLEHGRWFNAPWGVTLASSDFGEFSHDLLIGNFGSGEIAAFNPVTGHFDGLLRDTSNNPIHIMGLWGLSFGDGATGEPATALYFAAGSNNENGGLLGDIVAVQNDQGNDQ